MHFDKKYHLTRTANPRPYNHLPAFNQPPLIPTTITTTPLTPLKDLRLEAHQIPAHDLSPNTSLQHHPLLIYRSAFPSTSLSTSQLEAHFSSVGVVNPQWRHTMYSTSHFHSTSHEVLAIAHGRARLCFGGEDNPGRVETEVRKGDVLVVPAGVAHRLLEDVEGSFLMVGCYPPGCNWDMYYEKAGEEEGIERIEALPWFEKDPVYGENGPALYAQ